MSLQQQLVGQFPYKLKRESSKTRRQYQTFLPLNQRLLLALKARIHQRVIRRLEGIFAQIKTNLEILICHLRNRLHRDIELPRYLYVAARLKIQIQCQQIGGIEFVVAGLLSVDKLVYQIQHLSVQQILLD